MKLEFKLLAVDDEPDNLHQALASLTDHLDTIGFKLKVTTVDDVAQLPSLDLGGREGKNYDLVMIDYNLGQTSTGADIALDIRSTLRYTDMVFYSSLPVPTLLSYLAEVGVSGVFAEERSNLDDALTALADTIIGKAVDLNHMRGIAMAEVAEMDVLMEETLKGTFANATAKCVQAAADRTCEKVLEAMSQKMGLATERVEAEGVVGLVGDSLLFSSVQKGTSNNCRFAATEAFVTPSGLAGQRRGMDRFEYCAPTLCREACNGRLRRPYLLWSGTGVGPWRLGS